MRLFVCFGGAAPVADDESAAPAARHRGQRARSRLSLRGKYFLHGNHGRKRPSSPAAEAKKPSSDVVVQGFTGAPAASAVASGAPLSSASSSSYSYSTASAATSSRSSTASSSSPSVSGELSPKRRQANGSSSPAAGAAAVALCLLMVVFCGRVGATLLASTALYLFPRRWPAKIRTDNEDDAVDSKVAVLEGFLVRNRKRN